MFCSYLEKFQGAHAAGVPIPPWSQTGWSFLGSFIGIALLGLIQTYILNPEHFVLFVPAFGAMAVLLFSFIKAPPSQPYNTILGNGIGGFVGVLVFLALKAMGFSKVFWLSGALSVSLTIVMQEITGSQHPPGGATALIFAIVVDVQRQRFMYIAMPALLGAAVLVVVATIMNNLSHARQYPQWWSPIKPRQEADRKLQVEMHGTTEVEAQDSDDEESPILLYFRKFAGAGAEAPAKPELTETFFSFLGSFAGMSALGLFHTYFFMPTLHLPTEVAAFGAMSVLVFSLAKAPLSQPMNAILGNTIGGVVGCAIVELMKALGWSQLLWLSGALSVSVTIVVQERCNAVHPPGGATAMLFVVTTPLQKLGAKYIFAPAFLGTVIIVTVGLLTNNLSPKRTYPQRWWFNDDIDAERKTWKELKTSEEKADADLLATLIKGA